MCKYFVEYRGISQEVYAGSAEGAAAAAKATGPLPPGEGKGKIQVTPLETTLPTMRPCPFCGSRHVYYVPTRWIICSKCGGNVPALAWIRPTLALWNGRDAIYQQSMPG